MTDHDQLSHADEPMGSRSGEGDAADSPRPGVAIPDPPETSEPSVDDAIGLLRTVADRQVAEHVEIYAEVHRRLHDVLSDLDPGQGDDQPGTSEGGS